ncbi:monocarboxylate transporter 13-like [Acanthaster planci]|uniref:Monocarboxylate transporter 13-like n=1 Tax=Acanthaster planci TaxID=133434 RepID=A0A8B7YQ12_ACAPL|nr:monocarboxylate transporter 13-like [Acanthaster planci]XP_022094773.1 monocarboxylate transporter 13-like [Acanthaster planci]
MQSNQRSDRRQDRNSKAEKPSGTAVDGGWAWLVCLGAHLGQMVTVGYFTSLGVLYIEWKEHFDTSATASSWLLSLPWLTVSVLSLIIGALAQRLGVRRLAMVGGALIGLATILGSFATDIWQLYLCGVLSGTAASLLLPTGIIMITQYFKKRYALAIGLNFLGGTVGQMVFPPLIRLLIANYGWRGAMFILGAIKMNSAVGSALFRPKVKTEPVSDSRRQTSLEMEVMQGGESTESENRNGSQEKWAFLKVFTRVPFVLCLAAVFFYALGWVTHLSHLPSRAKEAGSTEDQGALLLTIFAVVSMTTRTAHGWFVDKGYIGSFQLQFGCLAGAALATSLNPVSDSYGFLVSCAVLLGACLGIASPLMNVILKTLVTEAEIPSAMSWFVAVFAVANGTGSVVAGKIYDITGGYTVTYLTGGGFFVASLSLLVLVSILKRRKKRRANYTRRTRNAGPGYRPNYLLYRRE